VSIPRKADVELRGRFLAEFAIRTMNVFEGVFDDTARVQHPVFAKDRGGDRDRADTGSRVSVPKNDERGTDAREQLPSAAKSTTCPATTRIRSASQRLAKENMTSILLKCIDDIDSQLGFRVADAAEVKYTWIIRRTLSARSYAILCVNKKCRWMNRLGW
jgi:hypothetical protein